MKKKICMALMGVILLFACSLKGMANGEDKILIPEGFINSTDRITVSTSENESKELVSIRVKLDHGAYRDITDTKSFTVNDNCTAYVKIRYKGADDNEETVELTENITNFDGLAPNISAYIKGEELILKVSDDVSGAGILNIDGKDYSDLKDDGIGINLKELESTKEYLIIHAFDKAGNRSNTLKVNNPYYVGEKASSSTDRSVDNPQSTDETLPTSASGLITSHTDENGEDMMNVSYKEWKEGYGDTNTGSKQFFTVKTKSDKVFYIVVDESYGNQTAYLLTEASENDLLNFVNYDGNSIDTGKTDIYSIDENDKKTVETPVNDENKTEAPKEKKSGSAFIILFVCLAGAAAYFVKIKKKKDTDDEDEFDEFNDDNDFESAET